MSNNKPTDRSKGSLLRSVISAVFSVLLFLSVILLIPLFVLQSFFSSTDSLATKMVSETYLDYAMRSAEEVLISEAIYYGIDEELLLSTLDRETVRACADEGAKSFVDALFYGGEYQISSYPTEPFLKVLNEYVEGQLEENPELIVSEEAKAEVAASLAERVSFCAAPMVTGFYDKTFSVIVQKIPSYLPAVVQKAFFGISAFFVISFLTLVFLQRKRFSRLVCWVASPLYCGTTLLFVPVILWLLRLDINAIALSEGVTLECMRVIYDAIYRPFVQITVLAFAVSSLLVLVALVLHCRADCKRKGTLQQETQNCVSAAEETEVDETECSEELPQEQDLKEHEEKQTTEE